jgi:hypothetical protein
MTIKRVALGYNVLSNKFAANVDIDTEYESAILNGVQMHENHSWREATAMESQIYNTGQLPMLKRMAIDRFCTEYDKNYTVSIQWTFNDVSGEAILKNKSYPVDNRAYAVTRIGNFRDQVAGSSVLVSDPGIVSTYQNIYGRNPVLSDFFTVPLHKYTDGRVKYVQIKTSKKNDFITLCNDFLGTISANYTSGYQPFMFYLNNQVKHANAINACTTVQDLENYTYTLSPLALVVPENIIQNVEYA